MKLQAKLQDKDRERAIADLKDTIQMLREDVGKDDTTIFNIIKKRHHYNFSDEKIRKYMNETK